MKLPAASSGLSLVPYHSGEASFGELYPERLMRPGLTICRSERTLPGISIRFVADCKRPSAFIRLSAVRIIITTGRSRSGSQRQGDRQSINAMVLQFFSQHFFQAVRKDDVLTGDKSKSITRFRGAACPANTMSIGIRS